MAANTAHHREPATISLRALYRPLNRISPRGSPSKISARHVPKSNQTHRLNRVQKPLATESSCRLDDNLPQKFSSELPHPGPNVRLMPISLEYIDQSQEDLANHAESELNRVGDDLQKNLSSIIEETETNLVLAERKEKELLNSIAGEQLQIISTSASREKTEVFISLGERMTEFEEIVNRHENALEQLWKDWQATQDSIAALWVQVLGPEAIPIIEVKIPPALRRVIDAGTLPWKQVEVERQSTKDEAQALRNCIEETIDETLNTVKEQEKVGTKNNAYLLYIDPNAHELLGMEYNVPNKAAKHFGQSQNNFLGLRIRLVRKKRFIKHDSLIRVSGLVCMRP